ncbi:MAG: type II toxin-antitoxin system prevent-host-death family antitoxin [Thiomargarita sp.]|nr:type II toxin-antitoxin system prevent-host-death family antitoxin [Thiomargarita sp.]
MNSKIVDVTEVQTHLTELLSLVEQGTQVIISKNKMPMARLMPMVLPHHILPRIPGLHAGSTWTSEDFDEPLDW